MHASEMQASPSETSLTLHPGARANEENVHVGIRLALHMPQKCKVLLQTVIFTLDRVGGGGWRQRGKHSHGNASTLPYGWFRNLELFPK